MAVQSLQEHIAILNQKLDVVRAHAKEKVIVQNDPLPKADDIRTEIADLRKNIQQKRRSASESLEFILTEPQRKQIERMRRGELLEDVSDRKESER
jgi:hypothetical protein